MFPRKPIRVPRYLAPLARKIRDVERIMAKGLVVETPGVKSQRLRNGRVQLTVK